MLQNLRKISISVLKFYSKMNEGDSSGVNVAWKGRKPSSSFVVFSVIGVLLIIYMSLMNISLYYKMTTTNTISNASHSLNFLTTVKIRSLSVEVPVKPLSRMRQSDEKLILLFTPFFGNKGISGWHGSTERHTFKQCPFKCRLTANKQLINESDALVYHSIKRDTAGMNHLPLPRRSHLDHQIWAFFLLESPANWITQFSMREYDQAFNWTVTYRRDSDVHWPYGKFLKLDKVSSGSGSELPTLESVRHKKLAAVMTSRCKRATSDRELYIKKLQKYVPVDHYGACGNLSCSRAINCYESLSKSYKFWLAFENSFCLDYVTEKFFKALRYGMVPVVYGFVNYSEFAPSNSFIDANQYKTPRELAIYLLHLDRNPEEYLKYFSWRNKFRVIDSDSVALNNLNWCAFCSKLHQTESRKWYTNVEDWYRHDPNNNNKSVCLRTYTDVLRASKATNNVYLLRKKSKRRNKKSARERRHQQMPASTL